MAKKQQVILLHGTQALTSNMKDGKALLAQGEVAIYNAEEAKDSAIYATTSKDELVVFPSKTYVDDVVSNVSSVASGIDSRLTQAEKDIDALEAADITINGLVQENATAITQEVTDRKAAIAAVETAITSTNATIAGVDGRLQTVEADYLKAADKNTLSAATDAVSARVKTIEEDYLKAADKDELTAATAAVASDLAGVNGRLQTVEGDYLKAADKNTLSAATDAVSARVKTIEEDYLKAADKNELTAATADVASELAAHVKAAGETYATKVALESVETGLTKTITEGLATKADKSAFETYTGTTMPAELAKKTDKTDFEGHTQNTDIHVTATAQTRWNAAATAIESFLDENAVQDEVINTLVEIRDFLTSDEGTVEKLLGDVAANASAITENATAIAAINTTISKLDETYATDAELSAAVSGVNTEVAKKLDITGFTAYTAATNTTIETLATKSDLAGVDGRLQTVEGDYLKAADKNTLSAATDAVSARVKTIEEDYLKAADKNTLSAATAAVASDLAGVNGRLQTVEADYLKAADKNTLSAATDAVSARVKTIEEDYLKAADKNELTAATAAVASDLAGVNGRLQTVEGAYVKQIKWADGTMLNPASNVIDMSTIVIDCGTY